MDEPQKPAEQPAEPVTSAPPETPETTAPGALATPPPDSSAQPPVSSPDPMNRKKMSKVFFAVAILFLLAAIGVAAWYFTQDKNDEAKPEDASQSQQEATDESADDSAAELKTTTYTSGLQHKTTVAFEHPAGWTVTEKEEPYVEGATLKSLVIGSEQGHFMQVFDRDGLGGYCEPNEESYTLTKEIATKTSNLFFKDFSAPTQEHKNHVLLLETEGMEWSVASHDALAEGQSATDTCNITNYSTVGASGVFIIISDSANIGTEGAKRLGWEDIKDDAEFVKMLESIVAVDKS